VRASNFAFGLAAVSVVGFLLAWVFNWPSTFVLDETAADTSVSAEEFVTGTVTSIPLVPLVVLLLAATVSRRSDRWGTAGAVVLTLLGLLFTIGGLGEVLSDNDEVARVVLVVGGLVFVVLGLALAVLAAVAVRRSD
jgi:hypothetical protein